MSFIPQHFLVWAEIPVTDLDRAQSFYEAVTMGTLSREMMGPEEIAIFDTVKDGFYISANLFVGKPATDGQGPVAHFAAKGTAEEMVERVKAAGGKVVSDIFEIPPGRNFYARDPDGNRIGFFEPRQAA